MIPERFAHSPHYKWIATATVILGMLGSVLSSTMVNVAIPDVMGAYGIGQDQAHWMSTATLAAMPVMMLTNGWFVNNFGARNTYVWACAIFCIASLIGQFTPNYYGLVAIRTIQGACSGLLQPLTMTVIFPLFDERERGKAMGIYGMGFILGPALGPTCGGLIVDHLHWQDIFGWSIPIMLVAMMMGLRYLPGRRPDAPKTRLNWFSLVLVACAIGTFLTAISNGPRDGWASPLVFGLFFISASCMLTFIVIELTTRSPLLEMRLFADRTFTVSVLVGAIFGAGMFGSLYLLPIFAQTVLDYSAFKAGILLMITGLLMVPTFPIGGQLAQGERSGLPIALGMLMFGVSSLVLAGADIHSAFWFVALWAAFGRIGLSIAMPSLQAGALRRLSDDLLPYGAGTMNFVRMTGAALGTNVIALAVDTRLVHHADHLAATQTSDNPTTVEMLNRVAELLRDQGVSALEETTMATRYLSQVIIEQANTLAYQDGFTLLAIAFFLAAISALALAVQPRRRESMSAQPSQAPS
ncbi:MAG: DHA2 family efflux MFS transporter permease subunit [Pseudomonadota bacterium]